MQLHGGNIEELVKDYNLKETEIVDFSSNINPLGFPSGVAEVIQRELSKIATYPDPNCTELREIIAHKCGVEDKNIIVGNGSTEFIYLVPRILSPKRALLLLPTFSEYEKSLRLVGCQIYPFLVEENTSFRVNVHELVSIMSHVDLVWICNPNNPTGVLLPKDDTMYLINEADKKGITVVIDEAFIDFSNGESMGDEVPKRKNLIVIKSMTKFYGIPGIRLGYVIASESLIECMERHKEPWTVNVFAQKAGIVCLKDAQFELETKKYIQQERNYLFCQLAQIDGLTPSPSSTNYILIKIAENKCSSRMLYEKLAQQGILIRDCRSFKYLGDTFIRVAVRKREENILLLCHLKTALVS